MSASYRPCPHCGLPNIIERQICKRCRGSMVAIPRRVQLEPATEETLTLYPDRVNQRLLTISNKWLEYAAPDIAFRTPWSNLTTIHRAFWEYHLYMLQEPVILRADWQRIPRSSFNRPGEPTFAERRIDLNGFGFPANKALCADLRRYAPQLSRFIPTQTK